MNPDPLPAVAPAAATLAAGTLWAFLFTVTVHPAPGIAVMAATVYAATRIARWS